MTRKKLRVLGVAFALAYASHTGMASAQVASGPFNVRTFGAVGNGTTDDTAAFNAAIAAVPPSGGEIYIPAGKYRLTQMLTITNKSIAFRGEGQRISKLVWSGPNIVHGINYGSTSPTVNYTFAVRSLSLLRGCSTYTTTSAGDPNDPTAVINTCQDGTSPGAAIAASWPVASSRDALGAVTATIHDVHVSTDPWPLTQPHVAWANVHWFNGISLGGATNAKISNFNIHGDWLATTSNYAAIQLHDSATGVEITDGDISQWQRGVEVGPTCEDVHIADVETGAVQHGFVIWNTGTGTSITNSHSYALLHGIITYNRGELALTNNLFFSFPCNPGSQDPSDPGNCSTKPFYGIRVYGDSASSRIRISGNEIYPQDANRGLSIGIELIGNVSDSTILGNYIVGMNYGIYLGSLSSTLNTTGTVVVGNRVTTSKTMPYCVTTTVLAPGQNESSAVCNTVATTNHLADNY